MWGGGNAHAHVRGTPCAKGVRGMGRHYITGKFKGGKEGMGRHYITGKFKGGEGGWGGITLPESSKGVRGDGAALHYRKVQRG